MTIGSSRWARRFSRRSAAWIAAAVCLAMLLPGTARADNPIVQTIYTADPAPLVYNGRVYLYTGHDEDGSTYFTMKEWRVWSSADMVNWTDHGSPLSLATFSWASTNAWAGQAVFRNGKFYWYVPMTDRATGAMAIGVAVVDQPDRAVHRRARPSAGRERSSSTRPSSSTTTGRRTCTGATRICGTSSSTPT